MILSKRAGLLLIISFFILSSAAYACGSCANASVWYFYPPALPVSWVGLAWFLSLSAISLIFKENLSLRRFYIPVTSSFVLVFIILKFGPGVFVIFILLILGLITRIQYFPKFLYSIIIAAGLALIGTQFGVLVFMPLLIISLIASIEFLRLQSLTSVRKANFWIAFLACIMLGFTGYFIIKEIAHPESRTPVDTILKWDMTALGRSIVPGLKSKEPESLKDYREIVQKVNSDTIIGAVKRIENIGDPKIDVPILIDTLKRLRKEVPKDEYIYKDVEKSLRKMIAINLPENTDPDTWLMKWNEKSEGNK